MNATEELRAALLTEQFASPVPEWHASVDELAAQQARVREIESSGQGRNEGDGAA